MIYAWVAALALAQTAMVAPPITTPAEAPAAPCCAVAARTLLEIEILDTINSKDNHNGQSFNFRLAAALVIDGRTLIPAGTPGVGEVVHAARARAMGKAGELILAARYLDLGGTRIPLRTLRFGQEQGRDNSGTVNTIGMVSAATIPAVSMVAFLIAGGEVRVPAGTRATAQTVTELMLAPVE